MHDLNLAPALRLTSDASHQLVDFVFGGALLLAILIAAALAWRAWVHGAALDAEVWKTRGLRPGLILLGGVAEPVETERSAAEAGNLPPFVELTIHQHGEQRSSRNSSYVVWSETSRSLTERPFILRTDDGTRVHIEPSGNIDLIDRLELPMRDGRTRTRLARITAGEQIWVRGPLSTGSVEGGPYRGDDRPYTIRPPADRPLFISSEPVAKEDRDLVRLHGLFGLLLAAVLVFCQAVLFGSYRALRSHGVQTQAQITDVATWVTTNKNRRTTHYAFTFAWNVADKQYATSDQVGAYAWSVYKVGDLVPIVYDPQDPSTMMAGRMNDLGLTDNAAGLASVICGGALIVWLVVWRRHRPWWRKTKLDETEQGTL